MSGLSHEPPHHTSVEQLVSLAEQALADHDCESAINLYNKALHTDNKNSHAILGIAGAYEHKAQQTNEEAFFKLAFSNYDRAMYMKLYIPESIDGLIRVGTRLTMYDEVIAIIKRELKITPNHELLSGALKKIQTISLLSIPENRSNTASKPKLINRLLFDFVMPFAGIVMFLMGVMLPQYGPRLKITQFSFAFFVAGLVLFLAYIFSKIHKAPEIKKRKNW
ncbi:MAG: hypothetical protein GF384_07660 [Elusimicrobia bacterium]|nr:hypothetical protein [Elusimicrobiota bacterium]MBD3412524.1 hypothetical protein [Elusimicrobiota bacterium]